MQLPWRPRLYEGKGTIRGQRQAIITIYSTWKGLPRKDQDSDLGWDRVNELCPTTWTVGLNADLHEA